MRCYYVPENLNIESRDNTFELEYKRDEAYTAFVGLAVAGSIFVAISAGSLIAWVIRCFWRPRSGREGTMNVSKDMGADTRIESSATKHEEMNR